jgi:hypothetical protein
VMKASVIEAAPAASHGIASPSLCKLDDLLSNNVLAGSLRFPMSRFARIHPAERADHVLLQRPQRPQGENCGVHRQTDPHDKKALSLSGVHGPMWALRSINQEVMDEPHNAHRDRPLPAR